MFNSVVSFSTCALMLTGVLLALEMVCSLGTGPFSCTKDLSFVRVKSDPMEWMPPRVDTSVCFQKRFCLDIIHQYRLTELTAWVRSVPWVSLPFVLFTASSASTSCETIHIIEPFQRFVQKAISRDNFGI